MCNSLLGWSEWAHQGCPSLVCHAFVVGPSRGDSPLRIIGFGARLAQLPSSPPPNAALSEPLPGGIQGWLRAQSDIRTCSPAPRRGARRWSSHPNQRRKRGPGSAARGQADQGRMLVRLHDGEMRRSAAGWQTGVRRCSGRHWTVEHRWSNQFCI